MPQSAYQIAGRFAPGLAVVAAVLCMMGLYIGFFVAPSDPHQGEHFRIAFLHLPSKWISLFTYVLMTCAAGHGLLARRRLSSMFATALAPTGAMFAFLALWTGSLWGKPMWGTWWVWEASLATEMLVLFLFLGFIALTEAVDDCRRADRAGGVLALVGIVGLPLLYFSVHRWSLHYGTYMHALPAPSDEHGTATAGLLLMTLGLAAYGGAAALVRVRNEILKRERSSDWVTRHFREKL